MRSVIAAVFGLALLSACASSSFAPTPSANPRPAYDGEVTILTAYPAEGTYQHLGIVSVIGRAKSTEENLLELMVEVAARHGANTIIVQSKPIKVVTTGGEQLRMAATAIWRGP